MTPAQFEKFLTEWAPSVPVVKVSIPERPGNDPRALPIAFAFGKDVRGNVRVWAAINPDPETTPTIGAYPPVPVIALNIEAWLAVLAQAASTTSFAPRLSTIEVTENIGNLNYNPHTSDPIEEGYMVTKQDFENLAREVREITPMEVRVVAMRAIINWAVRSNPRFDGDKFARACGIDTSGT